MRAREPERDPPYTELTERARTVRRPRLQPPPRRAARGDRALRDREADAATAGTGDRRRLRDAPVEERIHNAILRRRKDGIEAKIDEALTRRDPVDVLNEVLLPAMKDVGDRFGAGELILPFVLQSAEVMKKAVAHLEQFLEKSEGATQGQGRARDRVRRRSRHRQEPRQYDPREQRLHRATTSASRCR